MMECKEPKWMYLQCKKKKKKRKKKNPRNLNKWHRGKENSLKAPGWISIAVKTKSEFFLPFPSLENKYKR